MQGLNSRYGAASVAESLDLCTSLVALADTVAKFEHDGASHHCGRTYAKSCTQALHVLGGAYTGRPQSLQGQTIKITMQQQRQQ